MTRTHGNTQSQLDHILVHENLNQSIIIHENHILNCVTKNVSDLCVLAFGSNEEPARRPKYDLRRLGIPKVAREFDSAISEAITQSAVLAPLKKTITWHSVPLDQCDAELTEVVKEIAEKQLWPSPEESEKHKERSKNDAKCSSECTPTIGSAKSTHYDTTTS